MEKQVILNIHNHPIVTNLFISTRNSHRFTYVGGQINMTVSSNYDLRKIEKSIEKVMSEKKISLFNSSLYIGKDYIDILGKRKRLVVLNEGMNAVSIDDMVVNKRENIDSILKKFTLDIITQEVRKLEKIMLIPIEHKIKITAMRSCSGKNYYQKKLLTFDKDLIHYSLEIIDSIVIHELAHYYYHDHSPSFYNMVLKYCPNYKELQRKLTYGERK
ncbi:MAG: M48 family metallopeptidase [Bacilli bacterium]|nr:M48 family metallopeptidase [Erysipelotrichaceae bacterium]MDD7381177.1 M48 family metallopeptidase [Bacillales bacterium]MDY2746529.1 M48 family metallopeptidase [Bacilli bacterium]MDY3890615.1 M48 family metallopeptidase [Bacilli bacterium]